MKPSLTVWMLVAALALLSACSTPETRIKKNPDTFAKFPPAAQELIKRGQIALGFDQEMVKVALGSPDRVRTYIDTSGSKEIWSYTSYHLDTSVGFYGGYYPYAYAPYYRPWGYYPYYGGFGGWGYPYSASIPYEHFRVEFREGKVVSIEQEES